MWQRSANREEHGDESHTNSADHFREVHVLIKLIWYEYDGLMV